MSSQIMTAGNGRWFRESSIPIKQPGRILQSYQIQRILHRKRSDFQEILVFEHAIFGRMLVLDGIVQLAECDECVYHEMLVHPALFSHPAPRDILVIGGGDGGVLREVLRHPVRRVTLVELDPQVVEVARRHLPFAAAGAFENPKVRVVIRDGLEYLRRTEGQFDVIIVDSTDPIGPSTALFGVPFYRRVARRLRPDGVMMAQVGTFLDYTEIVRPTYRRLRQVFASAQIYRFAVPSFLCGDYAFIGAAMRGTLGAPDYAALRRRYRRLEARQGFHFYSPDIHRASMALPPMWAV